MYSLGCYSSTLTRHSSSSCRPMANYNHHQSAPQASKLSELRPTSSIGNIKVPERNSSRVPVGVSRPTPLLVSSLRDQSEPAKTSMSSVPAKCPSSTPGNKLTRRQTSTNSTAAPCSGQCRTQIAPASGSQRLQITSEKRLVPQKSSATIQNGYKKISTNSYSSASTMRPEQSIVVKKAKISSSQENIDTVPKHRQCTQLAPSSPTTSKHVKTKNNADASVSSFLANELCNTPSSTSTLGNYSSVAPVDDFMVTAASEGPSQMEDEPACVSSVSSVAEDQPRVRKSGKKLLILASSERHGAIEEAPEYMFTSPDCETSALNLETESSAANRTVHHGCSSSDKYSSPERETSDVNLFLSTPSIDDQRAMNEVPESLTPYSSKRFVCEVSGVPSTSFLSEPLKSFTTISEQQGSFSNGLHTDEEGNPMAARNDTEQKLEFFDSHFAFNEAELNSTSLPMLLPPIEKVEMCPIITGISSNEHQISTGDSYKVACIDMTEPYVHLKSILKTTTKYPVPPKKALSIQEALAWYVAYYWNYSKGAKEPTAAAPEAAAGAPTPGNVHRAKINDGRAVLDDEVNDGGYFSDSKPENDEMIPAPVVVRRVTFAEPMVTTVHHYIGAQKPKRTSPNVSTGKNSN